MRVLVTGANGFVGSYLCRFLEKAGHEVVAITRREIGTLDGNTLWQPHLTGCAAVVHCAAKVHVLHAAGQADEAAFRQTNIAATTHLAEQAAEAGISTFIYLSSTGVYGNHSTGMLNESSPVAPLPHYAMSKYLAEEKLRALGADDKMAVTIIRPPLIYGPGVKANFLKLLRGIARGLPLPLGAVRNKRDMVYVGNLASLITLCLTHPAAAHQTFLASDGEAISTTRLIQELANRMGRRPRNYPLPQTLLYLSACALGRKRLYQSLCGSLQLDISKAQTLLGWTPPYTLKHGLDETVEWFMREEMSR